MFCSKCGNEMKEGEKFCSKCGNEIEQEVKENNNENSLNNTVKLTPRDKFINLISSIISIAIIIAIIGGVFYCIYWFLNGIQEDEVEKDILSVLNQDGSSYTDKSTFTKEDIKIEEVVESDYRPIYKINISNGDILYIGLIYPNGKGKALEYFCINSSLNRVQDSINQR